MPVVDVPSPSMPQGWQRGSADRLAARAAAGREAAPSIQEPMAAGGVLMHVANAVRNASGQITGVVVASDYLSGDLAERRAGCRRPTRTTRSCAC